MTKSMDMHENLLFKYRAIRSSQNEVNRNTKRIVKNGELYFASPSTFNDPYDCRISVVPTNSPERFDRLKVLADKALPYLEGKYDLSDLSFKEKCENSLAITKYIESILTDDGYFKDHIIDRFSEFFGVLSLTKSHLNTLMWAHYADNHKGVCFGFDKNESPFKRAKAVKYSDDMPLLELEDLSMSELFVLTKVKHWEYENEYRVAKKGSGVVTFNKEAIKLVLFGCNSSREDIEEVKSWFDSEEVHCNFMKVKRIRGEFNMSMERI